VRFEIVDIKKSKGHKEFIARVLIENEAKGTGHGNSKKKAEQDAAFKTSEMLGLPTNPMN
jgi:ribonuclease-3